MGKEQSTHKTKEFVNKRKRASKSHARKQRAPEEERMAASFTVCFCYEICEPP